MRMDFRTYALCGRDITSTPAPNLCWRIRRVEARKSCRVLLCAFAPARFWLIHHTWVQRTHVPLLKDSQGLVVSQSGRIPYQRWRYVIVGRRFAVCLARRGL